ncbi:MAG: hypothetical protein KKF14_21355, partial [Alphaproteobacteria bacterium]|nr:hypothetical protein [Alphaproteobacteria bacterium]
TKGVGRRASDEGHRTKGIGRRASDEGLIGYGTPLAYICFIVLLSIVPPFAILSDAQPCRASARLVQPGCEDLLQGHAVK